MGMSTILNRVAALNCLSCYFFCLLALSACHHSQPPSFSNGRSKIAPSATTPSEMDSHPFIFPPLDPTQTTLVNLRQSLGLKPDSYPRPHKFAYMADGIASLIKDYRLALTRFDLILLIGPPDHFIVVENGKQVYQYMFSDKTKNDREVIFTIDSNGLVEPDIGWNLTGVNKW